jgi:hypothetical protein
VKTMEIMRSADPSGALVVVACGGGRRREEEERLF